MAIRRAIKDIREDDRPLADHLARQIRCGFNPCYTSDPEVRWET